MQKQQMKTIHKQTNKQTKCNPSAVVFAPFLQSSGKKQSEKAKQKQKKKVKAKQKQNRNTTQKPKQIKNKESKTETKTPHYLTSLSCLHARRTHKQHNNERLVPALSTHFVFFCVRRSE